MTTLLHICCAPCSVACIDLLRSEGIEPHGLWFNPNIHPFTEYESRLNALGSYAKDIRLMLDISGSYGLRDFLSSVPQGRPNRCEVCYDLRLDFAAAHASSSGFQSFSTTLLISPYQTHELIKSAGQRAAEKYGISFLYRDFRPLFREGQAKARELGLYMQKYCGCIFSEEERYAKRIASLSTVGIDKGL